MISEQKKSTRIIWLSAIVLFSILLNGAFVSAQSGTEVSIKAELVWSESGGRLNQIYFSRFENQQWSDKTQISNTNVNNLLPAIGKGPNGVTWVVWSVINGVRSQLCYTYSDGINWSEPTLIPTGFTSNTAPSIVVTSDNVPHVVWAGFDGKVDNIYHIYFQNHHWSEPQKVNLDNAVPDILPLIGLNNNGNPWVYWSGYDGGGKYRNYSSVRNGGKWEDETVEDINNNNYQSLISVTLRLVPILPESITDTSKAAIYLENSASIQSLPLRYLK